MVTRFTPSLRQGRQEERQKKREAEVAASRTRISGITAATAPPLAPKAKPPVPPVGAQPPIIPEPELKPPEVPIPEFRRRFVPEIESLLTTLHPQLFPEIPDLAQFTPDIGAIVDFVQSNPDDFLARLRNIGRTPLTEALLIQLGALDEEIDELLLPEVEAGLATPQAVLELEPEWENARTGEVITQSERDKRFPLGFEAELDEWRLTAETGRNYFSAFKVFGEALTKIPKQWGASILQAIQGHQGASAVDKGWADRFIEDANTDLQEFVQEVTDEYTGTRLPIKLTDLATLPQSMAFSLTSMGAGLGVGVPIALTPVPGARFAAWFTGTAASGAVAFNMASYQIMQTYLEAKNEEMKAIVGRELTLPEEDQLKEDFSNLAIKYGLWEAVPEALSNLAFAKLLTLPLGKMVGRNVTTQIITKLTALYGEEFLTETITQKGQSGIEVEAGLREERISWVEAFKEIAPQTFLLTTVLGGLGQVGVSSVNRIKKSLKKEAGDKPAFDAVNENITENVFAEVEAESVEKEGVAPEVVPEITPSAPQAVPQMTRLEEDQIKQDIVDLKSKLKTAPVEERAALQRRISILEADLVRGEALIAPEVTPEVVPEAVPEVGEGSLYQADLALQEARISPDEAIQKTLITDADYAKARERLKTIKNGNWIEDVNGHKFERVGKTFRSESGLGIIGVESNEGLNLVARSKNILAPTVEAVKPPPPVEVAPTEVIPEVDVEVRRQLDELTKMADIWSKKLKTSEETKVSLAKFVRENLPPNIRGRFITSVAKVKTDAQLQTQMTKVQEVAEANAQKVLKTEIRKEIKRTQATVKDKILKGKFTPETQRRLDTLRNNLELDRDTARDKMAENNQKYDDGKLSHDDMLEANEALNYAGIDGMSSEELSNTLTYLKELRDKGRSERQARQEANKERLEATRTDVSHTITGGKGLKTGVGAVPRGELATKPSWLDAFVNWQYSLDDLADKISKFDPVSEPFQSPVSKVVAQAHRATARQAIGTKDAYKKFKGVIQEVYKVKINREVNQVLNGLGEEVNLGTFELTEAYKENHPKATTVTIKMTRDEMIAKFMQMQDPTLNGAFEIGMGWTQKVKDAVVSNLTEDEVKLSEAIFQFYEDYYPEINAVYQENYNVDMPKNAVYSPRFRDLEGDVTENVLTLQDAQRYAGVTAQSIKARQQSNRPLKFNGATSLLSNHIDQMEHFKAWSKTIRDLRGVFANTEIRQAIEQYHGRGIVQLLARFINQMARDGVETAATNRTADFLRRSFTKSILAIKPVVGLKQIPSLFAYISEMNTFDFFGGIADYWKSPITNFKFLYANSEGYRARVSQGFERDIRAATAKHGVAKISGQAGFVDWFLMQIRLADTFAVTQGMWAKYKAGLKQGLSQEEAIAAAEDTTNRTQPSFGIDTLSALQNSGSWFKLMTMFQNQPNKYFRIEGDNLRNFKYGRGSRVKAASTIILVHTLLPMMFQYIADAFQWKPERQLRAGLLGPLNFILIGGQVVQSAWGWLTDQPFDWQISPVLSTMDEIQKALFKVKKMISQGQDPYKDISVDDAAAVIEYLAKAVGQVLGLPTPYFVQVERQVRKKLQEDKDIDIKDFLFSGWALQPPKKGSEEKVEDLNLLLGEPEEGAEDKPLSEKPLPIYTTQDWFRDIGSVYKNVLPQDVLDDPNASKESKAWAEYEIARSKADILPNTPLYKINTEDNDNTIFEYYQQWKAREKITSLEELKEYDKQYPKSYIGNVSRQQYNVLLKYLEAEDKDDYLSKHPELKVNPRNEWLKENPTDNALLALGGQAKILSLKAYNEAKRLIKELDIPDDAIPEFTLSPEGSVENYFKYNEAVDEFSANSWEAQLIVAEDDVLREWLGREPIETPVRSLELKIKHRELFDTIEGYKDEDSPLFIRDDEEREGAVRVLKLNNSDWVDDMRRIEIIEKGGSDLVVEAWVERGKIIDEFGAGSSEAKVWLIDNSSVWDWAVVNDALTDDGGDWNFEVLRFNKKLRKQDDIYGDLATDEEREDYLFNHLEYHQDRRRRDAHGIDFPKEQIETYVKWYTETDLNKPVDWDEKLGWYEDDWFLIDNPEFHQTLVDTGQWKELRDFTKVPSKEVFRLWIIYNGLPKGQTREDYRVQHRDLDAWGVQAFDWKPIGTRGDEKADLSPWEELARNEAKIREALKELRK